MSTVNSDAFFDPVTRLALSLTVLSKPSDERKWLETLSEFTEAVVRETLEREDEMRALLDMPRKRSRKRSTGAAGAEQPPHGESNTTADGSAAPTSDSVPSAAERRTAAPSQEGAGSATGGAEPITAAVKIATGTEVKSSTIAEPASTEAEGASPSVPSGDDAGTPPADELDRAKDSRELDKPPKPATEHAALREPARRVERFKVRRMVGTRY